MRVARQAGPTMDTAAVSARRNSTEAKVTGSSGATPKRIVSISRPDRARRSQSDCRARGDHTARAAHDEPHHIAARRPERAAHAEVPNTLLDRVR